MLKKDSVKILYGETYDMLGIAVDSLKYYLFVSLFPNSTILIADTASIINQSSGDTQTIVKEGKRRLGQVQEIIKKYNLPTHVKLMSELFQEPHVEELIEQVQRVLKEIGADHIPNSLFSTKSMRWIRSISHCDHKMSLKSTVCRPRASL